MRSALERKPPALSANNNKLHRGRGVADRSPVRSPHRGPQEPRFEEASTLLHDQLTKPFHLPQHPLPDHSTAPTVVRLNHRPCSPSACARDPVREAGLCPPLRLPNERPPRAGRRHRRRGTMVSLPPASHAGSPPGAVPLLTPARLADGFPCPLPGNTSTRFDGPPAPLPTPRPPLTSSWPSLPASSSCGSSPPPSPPPQRPGGHDADGRARRVMFVDPARSLPPPQAS